MSLSTTVPVVVTVLSSCISSIMSYAGLVPMLWSSNAISFSCPGSSFSVVIEVTLINGSFPLTSIACGVFFPEGVLFSVVVIWR